MFCTVSTFSQLQFLPLSSFIDTCFLNRNTVYKQPSTRTTVISTRKELLSSANKRGVRVNEGGRKKFPNLVDGGQSNRGGGQNLRKGFK